MSFDLRQTLEVPALYNLFQKLSRTREYRQRFMGCIPIPHNGRVLEVGCGPGTNVEFVPASQKATFVGCDADARYIEHAKAKYAGKGQFFHTPVGGLCDLNLAPFNAVLAWGLLHHITDAEVRTLAAEATEMLESGGSFCTFDPCFTDAQGLIARILTACDRGRYVRYPDHYADLVGSCFPTVKVDVWPPGTVLPYSVTVMVATKS